MESYMCFPLSEIHKNHLESGNKVIMPASALSQDAVYPILFRIENSSNTSLRSHCGVVEFTADDGFVFLPLWMMKNMKIREGELVNIINVSLPKGNYIKVQPHTTKFMHTLSDDKSFFEKAFTDFSCLTTGDTIVVNHGDDKFLLHIVETKPSLAISLFDTDYEVEFATPLDYKEEEEKIIIDKVDPVLWLPYTIIHKILALFDSRVTISKMSILSKKWFAVTSSCPILKFRYTYHQTSRDKFFEYVAYTTSTFCKQHDDDAHTFSINVSSHLEPNQVNILHRCLGLILKKGVKVLDISIYGNPNQPLFPLPDILLSASSLTSITIHGCEFPASFTSLNTSGFKSLELLSLGWLPLDEGVIQCLTSGCPLLEEIILHYCCGVKSFSISGPQNLKKVEIYGASFYERVDIDAPNLCHLLLLDNVGWGPPIVNLASCKKLTTFCYNGLGVNHFLQYFPFIENLSFYLPSDCDNLKLSIQSLKRLSLHSNCDLDKIYIDAPNLLWFEYNCASSYNPFLKEDPSYPKACIKYHSYKQVDTLWFQKFRRFLDKNNIFKVMELVDYPALRFLEGLKVSLPLPYELNHFVLEATNNGYIKDFYGSVDAILWCFRPRSLSFSFNCFIIDSIAVSSLVKYAYEKLRQQVDKRRFKTKIVVCYSSGAKQHFYDLKSWLQALTHDRRRQTITFTNEEVIQEAQ